MEHSAHNGCLCDVHLNAGVRHQALDQISFLLDRDQRCRKKNLYHRVYNLIVGYGTRKCHLTASDRNSTLPNNFIKIVWCYSWTLHLRKREHCIRALALHSHGAAPQVANVSVPAHWLPSALPPASNLPLAPANASLLVSVNNIVNNGFSDAQLPNSTQG